VRIPEVRRTTTRLVVVAAAVALLACGCGASEPLSVSCGDFVAMDEQAQLKLASQWAHPARDGEVGPASEIAAPRFRRQLVAYCQDADHADDELKDLELRFG
jgi:hypothetical protein